MPADPGLLDTVASANIKTIAEMAAWSTAQLMAGAAAAAARSIEAATNSNSRALETYNSAVALLLKGLSEYDPSEAVASLKLLTGSDTGGALANLGAVVAAIQQLTKG